MRVVAGIVGIPTAFHGKPLKSAVVLDIAWLFQRHVTSFILGGGEFQFKVHHMTDH